MKLDIITPVGPGHEELVHRAAGSVNIAKDYSTGPFDEIEMIAVDDTKGELGRSQARNLAVADSKADWIFFLDADDLMHPEAFENFMPNLREEVDAVWGKIVEYRDGVLMERYQVPAIIHIQTLLDTDPYLTLQMGHFVKTEVAKKEPFNETMDTGEDWEYYLRMWSKYECWKDSGIYMLNSRGEHSTGPRSSDGKKWRVAVEKLIRDFAAPDTKAERAEHKKRMAQGFNHQADTLCGPGSTHEYTKDLKKALPKLLKKYGVKTLNNAGCGDQRWIPKLDCEYRAYDLFDWGSEDVTILDISSEQMPKADMILCRDVMIHMRGDLIKETLELFKKTAPLLLATSYDNPEHNLLMEDVHAIRINLAEPPFGLELIDRIEEQDEGKFLGLWRLK